MDVVIPEKVFRDSRLSAIDKILFGFYWMHGEEGCLLTLDELVKATKLSQGAIIDSNKTLKECGFLYETRRVGYGMRKIRKAVLLEETNDVDPIDLDNPLLEKKYPCAGGCGKMTVNRRCFECNRKLREYYGVVQDDVYGSLSIGGVG